MNPIGFVVLCLVALAICAEVRETGWVTPMVLATILAIGAALALLYVEDRHSKRRR